jgi:hypothetical protein
LNDTIMKIVSTERIWNITTSARQALTTQHVKRWRNTTFELHSSLESVKKAVVERILNVLKQTNRTESWNKQFNLKDIKYLLKDTVLFTDLNSWFKHNTQHRFEQILSVNDNSWKNKVDSEIYDEEINENMIEKSIDFHDDDSDVYDLSYVVNWIIILDDRKILHDSDTRIFNHANEFDFELWCSDQSHLIFDWCINWNYMHFSLCNQTIVYCFDQSIEMIKTLKKRNDWRDLKNILFHLQNSDKREFIIELISSWICKDFSDYITNDETSLELKVSRKDRKIQVSRNEILIIILSCFFCVSTNWLLSFKSVTSLMQSI